MRIKLQAVLLCLAGLQLCFLGSECALGDGRATSATPRVATAPADFKWSVADAPEILKKIKATPSRLHVVNLWATWCPPCKKEIPDFAKFGARNREKEINVNFVSGDDAADDAAAQEFLRAAGITGQLFRLIKPSEEAFHVFAPTWSGALPATFLYDAKGTLVRFWVGQTTDAVLQERVNAALDLRKQKR